MGGHSLVAQRRLVPRRHDRVIVEEALTGIGAETAAVPTRNEQIVRCHVALHEPRREDLERLAGQRCAALLAALAMAASVRASAKQDTTTAEAGELRLTQPGLGGKE